MEKDSLKGIKVLIVIAHDQFRDEEYLETRKALEEAGAEVVVASSHTSVAHGKFGLKVQPDINVSRVRVDDYGAIIFIGGPGVKEYFEDAEIISMVRAAFFKRILLGAICSAPVIFANAAIIGNRKVTAFPAHKALIEMSGAFYTERGVEQDGEIITARGPEDSRHFGEAIAKALRWRKERKGYLI